MKAQLAELLYPLASGGTCRFCRCDSMKYPMRYAAFEWLKEKKAATDAELLEALNKNGSKCSPEELNKVLMQLEINGLVTVRWVGKDKRRLEVVEKQEVEQRIPRINE
jgi:hypothetical protein